MSYDNPKRIVDKRMQGMIQSGGKSGIARTLAGTAKEMSLISVKSSPFPYIFFITSPNRLPARIKYSSFCPAAS